MRDAVWGVYCGIQEGGIHIIDGGSMAFIWASEAAIHHVHDIWDHMAGQVSALVAVLFPSIGTVHSRVMHMETRSDEI